MECHTEIAQRLTENRGLHARLMKKPLDQQQCAGCHAEHAGADLSLVRWDTPVARFDHKRTGYPLEGAHRKLECRKCHTPERIPAAERKTIQVKDARRTWLGMPVKCAGCHEDEHRQQLSLECTKCHTMDAWKPASRFVHTAAKFQLAGAHERVACEKCHPRFAGPETPVRFTGLSYTSCTPCHQDPHRGAFRQPCQACHTDSAWKALRTESSGFDHSRTKFPLAGKHTDVACRKCHKGADFSQPLAHARCDACHSADDPHRGQFGARANTQVVRLAAGATPDAPGDCAGCHDSKGWKPSTFGVPEHRKAAYPLEGRHAALRCEQCHKKSNGFVAYRGLNFARCLDCHADAHEGQFAAAPHGNRCEDCHTVHQFRPSTFKLARHAETRFPLAGAHQAVPCGECHAPAAAAAPKHGRFRFATQDCETCHRDPHGAQFRVRLAAANIAGGRCTTCHSDASWQDGSRFDHSKTRFALAGAHRAVACRQCHRTADPRDSLSSVVFSDAPENCAGCHEDVHGGQFAKGEAAADCARCHGPLRWKPSHFDHDRDSTFALTGGHQGVRCASCHNITREIHGKTVLMYSAAPRECAGCHRTDPKS